MDGSLRDAWDEEAAAWIRWARSPQLDHAFWRLNLPALLALVPSPGALTLDVGCGEGRVARELIARGHTVVGIEASSALAAAAREATPPFDVHVADAVAIPLDDDTADLAVASLVLMNLDDPAGALREVARVLRPGGRLVASLLHPLNSWGDAVEAVARTGDVEQAGRATSYFESVRYEETLERGDARLRLHDTHRPLSAYADALADAGFRIERLVEPRPDDAYVADRPEVARWRERPAFLHLRAVLGATGSA